MLGEAPAKGSVQKILTHLSDPPLTLRNQDSYRPGIDGYLVGVSFFIICNVTSYSLTRTQGQNLIYEVGSDNYVPGDDVVTDLIIDLLNRGTVTLHFTTTLICGILL